MLPWLFTALVVLSAMGFCTFVVLILRRILRAVPGKDISVSDAERGQNFSPGIPRLHQVSPHHHHLDRPSINFSWNDHPLLVTDAVENGWSTFAFTTLVSSSPSVKPVRTLLGPCAATDQGSDLPAVEIGWEVCEGSADFLQKIKLNHHPISRRAATMNGNLSVVRAALPLPGPNLRIPSFPQEAYFEITVIDCHQVHDNREKKSKLEGDYVKLVAEDFHAKNSHDSSLNQRRSKIDEVKSGSRKLEAVSMSVGLTRGGPLTLRIPGSYPGSIGFNSRGSVYLNGTKLFEDSDKNGWETSDKVVGCGYNPNQKKVFFTIDGRLVHEIYCQTDEYTAPLYPALAANFAVTLLVNLGQSTFKYSPANSPRTSNPLFVRPAPDSSPFLGCEDSREFFSMGRIDSQWLGRSGTRSTNGIRAMEYDQESEGELFDIVLESSSNGRSPLPAVN